MAKGCDETLDLEFYKYIWSYNKKVLPQIIEAVEKYDSKEKVVHLESERQISDFLNTLEHDLEKIRSATLDEASSATLPKSVFFRCFRRAI